MKIDQFIKSFVPTLKKDALVEDCKVTYGEIKTTVKPIYDDAAKVLKNHKFKGVMTQRFQEQFNRLVTKTHGNMVVTVATKIPQILENIEAVQGLIEKSFEPTVAAQGLTYLKAQMIQYVDAAGFFSSYARQWLNYVLIVESGPYLKEGTDQSEIIKEHLVPAEVQFVEANFHAFCVVLNALSEHTDTVEAHLQAIPDIVITQDNLKTLPVTVGEKKLDPFMMNFLPVQWNPIYHLRIAYADWQISRYHSAQRDYQTVQLRILHLKQLTEGKNNPVLEKKLEEAERYAQDLRAKLAKMEKSYA